MFEKWIYRYTSGFTFKEEIIFFDPTEANEHRLSKEEASRLFDLYKNFDLFFDN